MPKEKKMRLDLHTHSTASDGQYSPSRLVEMAKEHALELYALTDHDTVDGIKEAKHRAEELGVNFIPGIEISTHKGEEIHMLGLYIDEDCKELIEACNEYMASRNGRGQRICAFLKEKGIDISEEEACQVAGSGSLGRPHFAAILQERGIVKTRQEAFERFLDTREFHEKTDRVKPSPKEAIDIIHKAGGLAVLAHPGLLKMGKRWQESLIAELKRAGLDGIECFYNKHTHMQVKYYKRLARENGLMASCGSDFHGEKVKPNVPFGMTLSDEAEITMLLSQSSVKL